MFYAIASFIMGMVFLVLVALGRKRAVHPLMFIGILGAVLFTLSRLMQVPDLRGVEGMLTGVGFVQSLAATGLLLWFFNARRVHRTS